MLQEVQNNKSLGNMSETFVIISEAGLYVCDFNHFGLVNVIAMYVVWRSTGRKITFFLD